MLNQRAQKSIDDMFRRFVVPALTEQCEWLDNSMYHLDGTQCIDKLDPLLAIEALAAAG